jgi:hypothetical protein
VGRGGCRHPETARGAAARPGRTRPGRIGPGRIGSGRAGSGRVGSGRVGSGRVGSGRVGRSIVALAAELDDECDALYDLATFPVGHEEHLGEVLAGYGADADVDVIHAWWSLRSLLIVLIVRRLTGHGFGPFAPGCGVGVPRSRM